MDKIKNGAEEIYLAPETESSEELVLDEPIEEIENEDISVMVEAEPMGDKGGRQGDGSPVP